MGKFNDFNQLAFVLDDERVRYEDAKKRRVEELAEVNRKYDKIESDYSSWYGEWFPKYKALAEGVYWASHFKLIDVAYVAADIISAFSGEEYIFQPVTLIRYEGVEKSRTELVVDAIVATDNLALEYSPLEFDALVRDKKMVVLTDKHMDKDADFKFYESDEVGNLTFTTVFNRFQYVVDFFTQVISERVDVRPDLPYPYEVLDKLKNKYLLDNFDRIRVISSKVESEDKKAYDETLNKALLKLNVKKEYRAKMLTKIREFSNDEEGTNS